MPETLYKALHKMVYGPFFRQANVQTVISVKQMYSM